MRTNWSSWRIFALVLALALAVTGVLLVVFRSSLPAFADLDALFSSLSVERLEAAIAAWGAAAPLASIGLMVLHNFIPFPAEVLAIANGMLFGLMTGVAVTWTGAMLGAVLAFALARWLGQPFVQRLVGEAGWKRVEAWTSVAGVRALLLARLVPVISFNLINYAAGLTGIGWWTFIWTTAIGILPITIASVLVGSHMAVISWEMWAMLIAVVVALMLMHRYWRRASRLSHSDDRNV